MQFGVKPLEICVMADFTSNLIALQSGFFQDWLFPTKY